jgi:hypothetical protein
VIKVRRAESRVFSGARFDPILWSEQNLVGAELGRVQQVVFAVEVVRNLLLATKCKRAMLPVMGVRRVEGVIATSRPLVVSVGGWDLCEFLW